MRATLAHEIFGHHQAYLKGSFHKAGSLLDEVQASVLAARNTPGLNGGERFTLLRDAAERVKIYNGRFAKKKYKKYAWHTEKGRPLESGLTKNTPGIPKKIDRLITA
jgi:hypothetical protein